MLECAGVLSKVDGVCDCTWILICIHLDLCQPEMYLVYNKNKRIGVFVCVCVSFSPGCQALKYISQIYEVSIFGLEVKGLLFLFFFKCL